MPNGGHNPCCGNCIHYQKHESDKNNKCDKHKFYMPSMGLLDVICKDWYQDGKSRQTPCSLPELKDGFLYYYHYSCRQFAELCEFERIKNPISDIIIKNDKVFRWCGLLMKGTAEYFPTEGNNVILEIDSNDYSFSIDRRTTFQKISHLCSHDGKGATQKSLALRFRYLHSKEHPYIIYDWMKEHYKIWMPKEFCNKKDFRYALFEVIIPNERYRLIPVAPEARLW
jgi:hypothetical protein